MTGAIFTPMAGALGDMLRNYLEGELGHFESARAAGYVTAVKLWTVSDQAAGLFCRNPNILHVLSNPFTPAYGKTDEFRPWAEAGEKTFRYLTDAERAALPWQRPRFYLTEGEQSLADVVERRPFVAVHLFAGHMSRNLVRAGIGRTIVEAAASRMPVVLLGGDSRRTVEGFYDSKLFETFPDDIPNVTNIINTGSVSLHAHLASKATKYVGSVSCYNEVAQVLGIPALCFGSPANRQDMQAGGGVFDKMRKSGTAVHYLDQRPDAAKLVKDFLS